MSALDRFGGVGRTGGVQLGADAAVGRIDAGVGMTAPAPPFTGDTNRHVAEWQLLLERVAHD